MTATQTWAAIVLAGGRARRMAGADKLMATVADRTVLDRTLSAVLGLPIVAVGPARPTAQDVRWVSEEPPGGGPLAALAAGLAALPAEIDAVVVLAADQPGVRPATVARLTHALACSGAAAVGAVLRDSTGRVQWLTSVWRRDSLAAALPARPAGLAIRSVLGGLPLVQVPAEASEAKDVDTPADLAWWRAQVDEQRR